MSVALVLALAAAASAHPVEVWRPSTSGPKVILAPSDGPDAALRVVFMAGAADDGIEEGLTRLSQYALLHGQDRTPYADLDAALYGGAAELHVDTSVRECSFTLMAPRESFDALAARVLRQLLSPAVSDAGIERARHLARTNILDAGSDKWMEAFVAAQVLITEGVDGGGDYNNPIWGDPETLRNIPVASVKRHIAQLLAPANAIIVATGRFSVPKLKAALATAQGGRERTLRRPDVVKYFPFDREAWAPREIHVQIQAVDVTDAKSAALVHVLAAYLHDRLFWKLRKSGNVYSPWVSTSFEEWLDFISVVFTVTPGARTDLRAVMMDEIDTAGAGTIDEVSFRRAKAIARQRLLATEDSPVRYATALQARGRGVVTVGPEVRAALDAVSAAELADAAERFLARSHAVSIVFGRTRSDGK